jgi:cytochrome oxidase Cu insertion factor (SCO1/SenC/PrrC family)
MTEQINQQDKKARQRSRISLIVLIAIFLVPIMMAYIVHKNPSLQPGSTKNHGILYKPAVALDDFSFVTLDSKTYTVEQLRGKWWLIYVGTGSCEAICQETLLKAKNGIIAQGGEGIRVRYAYITTGEKHADVEALKKQYPGILLLNTDEKSTLAKFKIDAQHRVGSDDRLYLVDPAGNLLMHYPAGFKDLGLMEDLKHLLKWSQIG